MPTKSLKRTSIRAGIIRTRRIRRLIMRMGTSRFIRGVLDGHWVTLPLLGLRPSTIDRRGHFVLPLVVGSRRFVSRLISTRGRNRTVMVSVNGPRLRPVHVRFQGLNRLLVGGKTSLKVSLHPHLANNIVIAREEIRPESLDQIPWS